MPYSLGYLWEIFIELSSKRTAGMQMNAISYTDIFSYCQLKKITLTQFELSAIEKLDEIALTPPEKLILKGKRLD